MATTKKETGFNYPLSFDAYGSILLVSDYPERVKQAMLSALLTRLEERVWFPEYGLNDREFRAAYPLPQQLRIIRECLDLALAGFPDVSYLLRGAILEGGKVYVEVLYQVAEEEEKSLGLYL